MPGDNPSPADGGGPVKVGRGFRSFGGGDGPSACGSAAPASQGGAGSSRVIDSFPGLAFTALMQIESLKVFCDLAETESFTKAAQINGVTQSAVSQQISSLERQF